jgi:PAS domain S-box-containing protein
MSYGDLLRNSPDGLIVFDTRNVIRTFNRGAEEIFGYKAEEVIGKPFYFLIPPESLDRGEVEQLQEMVDKHGRLERCCVTRLHKDGTRLKLELTRSPILDKQGRIIGYESVFRDITQSVEFEKDLRISEKLSAVSTLVSGLAHELGTPLNIIHGHAELLLSELPQDSPLEESLRTVLSACHRMTALLKSLLQFISQKDGETAPVDIKSLIHDLLNFLRIQFRKQNIETFVEIEDDLPVILGDRTQVEEIFLNVMMNSIQAMENGGILRIKTFLRSEDGWDYLFSNIQDTGSGIPPDTIQRIFEPFFTTKGVGKGTGLGLYITHNLIQKYKGRIRMESTPGVGTTVTIILPVGPTRLKTKEES